jgi:integrase
MPRVKRELTPVEVRKLPYGAHAVGGVPGLLIQVLPGGSRTWLLRITIAGKRRQIGLGSMREVGLKQARERAREYRDAVREGRDPLAEREARKAELRAEERRRLTVEDAARQWLAAKRPELSSARHAGQIERQIERYVFPVIGRTSVDEIEREHVLRVIEPEWQTKNETMDRLRIRLRDILSWSEVKGHRAPRTVNPAEWKGNLDQVLPAPGKIRKVRHHTALAYADVPSFMAALREREATAARCLEFAILTGVRSGEARGAVWSEVDLDNAVWVIPETRMKVKDGEHRVPLSDDAIALLRALPRHEGTDLMFPNTQGGAFSDMALSSLLKRMKVDATPHGFRSSFRTWASECTDYPREVCEQALAHKIPSATEAAYRRGDLFAKRRRLMADWAAFCGGRI